MKAIAIVALLGSTAVAGRDTAHYELAWNGSAYTVGKRTIAADRARVRELQREQMIDDRVALRRRGDRRGRSGGRLRRFGGLAATCGENQERPPHDDALV